MVSSHTFTASRATTAGIYVRALVLILGALFATNPVAARILYDDSPPTGSRNGRFYAEPSKEWNTQVFEVLGPTKSRLVWEKPGWEYESYLSNDGEYLVSGRYCRGTLPRGFTPDLIILNFYRRSTLLRAVRLSDLVDVKKLKYKMWGVCKDFLPGNRFEIFTYEHYLVFDGTTGKLLEKLPGRGVPNID
jgi:hypothetical protein